MSNGVYWYVEPEVAGGLGPATIMDRSVHPPSVSLLNYEFEDWSGDVLLETFPCFVATEVVARKMEDSGFTGFGVADVLVTTSEMFVDLNPKLALPRFCWLKISGTPGVTDFGVAHDFRLVVSDRALKFLKGYRLENATTEAFR